METNASEEWIATTLKADGPMTALIEQRAYNTTRTGPCPCVLFQLQIPGNDFMVLGGERVWTPNVYLIRGIVEFQDDQASYAGVLAEIADRIEVLFHKASGSNALGVIYSSVRIRPFQMPETSDGRQWRHLGGFYRITAR